MTSRPVYVIGTFDTKAAELNFAAERVKAAGALVVTVDVSTQAHSNASVVSAAHVAAYHPGGVADVLNQTDRGVAVSAMALALKSYLLQQSNVGAVLGLGGSGNTAIVTAAMQAMPVGIPKLMVSTMASGNVAPFVGPSDIMMMHSVADIAGLNSITREIIGNAAHAVAGMALNQIPVVADTKPCVGLSMFGVTTPAVTQIRKQIEADFECFVFHATGIGGQCFETLIDSHFLSAAIDLTTTEVADHICSGILPCTDDRFGAIIRKQIPYVGSVGAVDMVNFGAQETVPEKFHARKLHRHNPVVTLMRTTADDNRRIGQWIVERINHMQGPVQFLLPLRGVSALDGPGQAFYDPEADAALFDTIRKNWKPAPNRVLIEVDAHINDSIFADRVVAAFRTIMK